MSTILIVVVVLLLLGGGGWGYSRRRGEHCKRQQTTWTLNPGHATHHTAEAAKTLISAP
jgi:hypothetical protein